MSYIARRSHRSWWVIGSIVIFIGLLVFAKWYSGRGRPILTNREVAQLCTTDMATQFHIHPHLKIFIDGKQQEIPADIGIKAGCMNSIHTHDASGELHVESPEKRDFTLDDFFAVWGKPFSKDQILDAKVGSGHVLTETVNGGSTQDFENTILRDGDQIEIRLQ